MLADPLDVALRSLHRLETADEAWERTLRELERRPSEAAELEHERAVRELGWALAEVEEWWPRD